MKKLLFLIFSAITLIFSIIVSPTGSQAAAMGNKENKTLVEVNKKDSFFDETIGKYMNAFKIENGNLVSINKEEYQSLIQRSEESVPKTETQSLASATLFGDSFRYSPSSTAVLSAPLRKVSATISCTTTTCRVDKTVNVTYTNSFTAGLTSPEIAAIKANAGFTWAVSASTSTTYSFTISKGQSGYIGFNPYYRKTTGTLYAYYNSMPSGSMVVEGRAPKKLSTGELDGIYTFIYQ